MEQQPDSTPDPDFITPTVQSLLDALKIVVPDQFLREVLARTNERPLRYWTLAGGIPIASPTLEEWIEWYNAHEEECIVGQEYIGVYDISTIFLGLNRALTRYEEPVLFETMVFKWEGTTRTEMRDVPTWRYTTWEHAEAGHQRMVEIMTQFDSGCRRWLPEFEPPDFAHETAEDPQ